MICDLPTQGTVIVLHAGLALLAAAFLVTMLVKRLRK